MTKILVLAGLVAGLAVLFIAWRNARAKTLGRRRLGSAEETETPVEEELAVTARPFLARHRLVPWIIGAALAGVMHFVFGWALPFVVALGLIVSLLGMQFEGHLAAAKAARIETQLADAIDLMVGALGAGASVPDALENALRETRKPLRPQLEEVVGRIRLGDDPHLAYRGLTQRVPLETFLLFASSLAVQSETGGSLAPTLASVGRTIRDRIEISRRIRSNSSQSEVSTVAVMLLTYFIALVMWRTNPEQMLKFLATQGGQWTVAGSVFLQAVGLVWMSFISRLRF